MKTELKPIHDSRKSFYNKAVVVIKGEVKTLESYQTPVTEIKNGKPKLIGKVYSATTLRHIKEFLLQNGFKAENKKQIEQDYTEEK